MANLFDELKRNLGLHPNMGIDEATEALKGSAHREHFESWVEYIAAYSRGKAKEWAEAALTGESPPEE